MTPQHMWLSVTHLPPSCYRDVTRQREHSGRPQETHSCQELVKVTLISGQQNTITSGSHGRRLRSNYDNFRQMERTHYSPGSISVCCGTQLSRCQGCLLCCKLYGLLRVSIFSLVRAAQENPYGPTETGL